MASRGVRHSMVGSANRREQPGQESIRLPDHASLVDCLEWEELARIPLQECPSANLAPRHFRGG